eukprot:CAMPEP_0172319912 /NCGR_PEP_ID=MMETSP1058-20130122/39015_1 /TAXON_ID=83371 /ORGANISM="Detonula confervacea, Strain CCMP 353" /LENGTH=546 /DNA_ID=CAMNT_0013035057 /DNA_START=278 /DNA_END=1915 /DNA_ORIENTATION=-
MMSGSTSKQVGSGRRSGNSLQIIATAIAIVCIAIVCVNVHFFYSRVELVGSATSQQDRSSTDSGCGSNNLHDPSPRTARNRDVDFLRFSWEYPEDNNDPDNSVEANSVDAFSASWWQSTAKFVNLGRFEEIGSSSEGASFEIFIDFKDDLRMTRDWLDLGVEHMSKWWKLILGYRKDNSENEAALLESIEDRIVDIFKAYVHSKDRMAFFNSLPVGEEEDEDATSAPALVTKSTIVVIAYWPDSSEKGIWSLAAMLISLIQAGMGRVVVSGYQPSDETIVRQSFSIVTNTTQSWTQQPWTELGYATSANATSGKNMFNVPQAALKRLRHVFENRTSKAVAQCWLGGGGGRSGSGGYERRDKWKYVFFGEQDLLLVTKPDALLGLGQALQDGRILAPHRLQPLPHASDFEGISGMDGEDPGVRLIPNSPPFEDVIEIDAFSVSYNDPSSTSSFDSCCDRGPYKPYLLHPECASFWWMCGYNGMQNNKSLEAIQGIPQVIVAHKRLLGYPFMRLKRGSGVVYASANWGKTCRPQKGLCKKWKRSDNDT